MDEGYRWVVDVDLDRFLDRVQHDVLMARVARKVTDRRVLEHLLDAQADEAGPG